MTTVNPPNPDIIEAEQSASWWLWIIPLLAIAGIWGVGPILSPDLPLAWLAGEKAAWYLVRASGTIAYLMMAVSTLWGLLLSTKLAKSVVSPAVALAMHNYLSWSSIGLTVFHAATLLFDSYYVYTFSNLIVPFTGPYMPLWVGLGTISLYIMVLTSASFYARRWIGQKNWRRLHYLTFGAFVLSTVHGWTAGTDTVQLANMYTFSGLSVLFLTFYRILTAGVSTRS